MLEKINKLVPDQEFFCIEIIGQHTNTLNTLIDQYNKYLAAFNRRKSSSNRIDRYTPKEEKEAYEYLTDLYKRLCTMITKNINPSKKSTAENIQESQDNYKAYILLMHAHSDKLKLFTYSAQNEMQQKPITHSVIERVKLYEQKNTEKSNIKNGNNPAKKNPNQIQEEISKAKEKIDKGLIQLQIEKDAALAKKIQKRQSFFGGIVQKFSKEEGAPVNIGPVVLKPDSRADIIKKLASSKGRMLDVDAIVEVATNLPLKQTKRTGKIFDKFTNKKPKEIFDFFNENNVTEPKLLQDQISGKDYFSSVLVELVKYKGQLGGSPVFGQNKPSIEDKDSGQFMFGVPMAAVKDWMRMTIAQKWTPISFWKNLGKKFGISDKQMSKYEEAYLCIQRFGLLIANKERFIEMLNKEDTQRYIELSQITGLAWHPTKNSAGVEKEFIEFIEQFLSAYFERAKKEGSEAMQEYFQAFRGVCLEDRARNLLEYAMKHPLDENTTPIPADWDTSSPAENAFEKEVQVLGIQIQDLPTPEQLYEFLQQKGIFDLEFTSKDGTKAKPTKESYDIWAQEMVDACVLNESNSLPNMHL